MAINIDRLQKIEGTAIRTSSKGNQNKWFDKGIWYKEDSLGYEALAEIVVSRLLKKTNAGPFVCYKYENLVRNEKIFHGCSSENFLQPEDDKIVSIERLFQSFRGISAAKFIVQFENTEDRIRYIVENTEQITGLAHFGNYLRKILTIDTLFLNEDRHLHNIAVIQRKDGTYRECPVFDHGAALFSDNRGNYPLEIPLDECFHKIQAKPFSRDFDEQLDACELLYGGFTFQASFTVKDLDDILAEFHGIYQEEILNRVRETMRRQIRKYSYLF